MRYRDFYYLRLSKEDGDDGESNSIASQRSCIRQYIKENFGSDREFEELSDDGYSGTSMERPAMKRLLHYVMLGEVRTIIVRDLSRFARNYLEAGHYLEYVFPSCGVRFISVNDHYDSDMLGEDTGGLELAIRNLINQMYSRDISRKIKSAVDLKKLSGEYVYGSAPYGYRKGERKNTIVVDEEAASVVREIFSLAAGGTTVTQIAAGLNDRGVPTPSVYLANVRGKYKTRKYWSFESVRNILTNRIYTGDTEPFKSHVVRVGSSKVRQIPEELRQIIPNTHEAIVSREMFYQARTTIKSVKKVKGAPSANPFASLLVCGCCGNKLFKGKERNKSWLCQTARYVKDNGCELIRVDEGRLKSIVLKAVNTQCLLFDAQIRSRLQKNMKHFNEKEAIEKKLKDYKRILDKIRRDKLNLYEAYAEGHIIKEEFRLRRKELDETETDAEKLILTAEERLSELTAALDSNNGEISELKNVTKFKDVTELTPELAKELIKKITVYPDGELIIEWNFKDELQIAQ